MKAMRVFVDGDVEELPSGAAGLVARIAGDTMAGLDDAGGFLMSMFSRSPGAVCS